MAEIQTRLLFRAFVIYMIPGILQARQNVARRGISSIAPLGGNEIAREQRNAKQRSLFGTLCKIVALHLIRPLGLGRKICETLPRIALKS